MNCYLVKIWDDKNDVLVYPCYTHADTANEAEAIALGEYAEKFGELCTYPVTSELVTADMVFDAVSESLRHGGEDQPIMIAGRTFLIDIEKYPSGVPEDDNVIFEFDGYEVTPEDIGVNDIGELYMDGCQEKKHYTSKGNVILSEC